MGENVFHNISRNLIFCGVYVRQSLAREARKVIHNRGRRRWKTFCHLYREMKLRNAIFAFVAADMLSAAYESGISNPHLRHLGFQNPR